MKGSSTRPASLIQSQGGKGRRVAIVAGRWHGAITEQLVAGATRTLRAHGVSPEDIFHVTAPGTYEIPLCCRELARSNRCDAIVALSTLIRGETDHYQLIASSVSYGLTKVMLESGIPIGFGILTAENLDQAAARAGGSVGNKGEESALAALEMLQILENIRAVSEEDRR